MPKVTKSILISVKLDIGKVNVSISEKGVKFSVKNGNRKLIQTITWESLNKRFLEML